MQLPALLACVSRYTSVAHAPNPALSLERHQRASPHAMAQSLLAVAHRDLHRRQDDADWISGILGIYLAGTRESMALLEVDWRDGTLRSTQVQRILSAGNFQPRKQCAKLLSAIACCGSATQHDADFGSFADAQDLCC
jgi:hypothetical protein